ncbi:hypothetical protein [Pseudoteredinibacter isoporae]|uniref:Uncharacterized protein n=1 Tax=Pseudoteredinibacter isoporae TaxID=570281 RepID=A0A7X0JRR6_9GAMM|nr:hypothetical protein [Pseudoteredinibacter isoporae]MBB6521098.1 hypothetical protein [Pseudoteredinibacter isoporae]NHO86662.1 hypothetical protein [Pseudoteredinibacter isoporae]NIB24886.1 hypothetical protein [Pseudoteredinibacter isoporae]
MKNLGLVTFVIVLLSAFSSVKPDYSRYVVGVPEADVFPTDRSENAKETSIIYAESGMLGKHQYIVLIEDPKHKSDHPVQDGRVSYSEAIDLMLGSSDKLEGLQAMKLPSGEVDLVFNWVGFNTGFIGGYKVSFPVRVSFNAQAGRSYIIAADGWPYFPDFYVRDLNISEKVEAKFSN